MSDAVEAPPRDGPPPSSAAHEAPGRGPAGRIRRLSSDQLFGPHAVELQIEHRGVLYRLKQTALGKLILTK